MRKVRVAAAMVEDIPPDLGKVVALGDDGSQCALFLNEGTWYAVGSLCPHQNSSLEGAPACAGVVTCQRHGYRFDLKTGDCLTVGGYGLPVFTVSVENDIVFVNYWEYD